jgi:hypothetical protein
MVAFPDVDVDEGEVAVPPQAKQVAAHAIKNDVAKRPGTKDVSLQSLRQRIDGCRGRPSLSRRPSIGVLEDAGLGRAAEASVGNRLRQ